ncbi:MAG: hypothetical protein LIV24_11390, partial [Eubacterium sp.]|nr:hypothetical protein [Eubacterium sp.]
TLFLGGCGQKGETADTAVSASSAKATMSVTPEEAVAVSSGSGAVQSSSVEEKILGKKASGNNIVKIQLTNSTGKAITGVALKYAQEEKYGDNFLPANETFKPDEVRTLYYDETDALNASNTQSSSTAQSSSDSPVVNPDYSMQFSFEDGSQMELHSVPLDDISTAALKLSADNTYMFLSYVSKTTKAETSTEETEKALYEAAQATPAPTQAADSEAAQNNTATTEDAGQSSGTNTYQAPDTSTQNQTYTAPEQTYTAPEQTYTEPDTSDQQQEQQTDPQPVTPDQGSGDQDGCIDDGLTW